MYSHDRLVGIDLRVELRRICPASKVDPEQFKPVIVNLVDHRAEAMRDSLVKRLLVSTQLPPPDTVEAAGGR